MFLLVDAILLWTLGSFVIVIVKNDYIYLRCMAYMVGNFRW